MVPFRKAYVNYFRKNTLALAIPGLGFSESQLLTVFTWIVTCELWIV
jgi:hypothetical protein